MIRKVSTNLPTVNSIMEFIGTGLLLLYKRESGIYLMLNKSVESYFDTTSKAISNDSPTIYSMDGEHPLFFRISEDFQLQHLPGLLIIENGEIINIVNGPLTKSELLKIISHLKKE